jgi:hypothetical protein
LDALIASPAAEATRTTAKAVRTLVMLPQMSLKRSVQIRKPFEHGGETPEYRRNSIEITIKTSSIHIKIFHIARPIPCPSVSPCKGVVYKDWNGKFCIVRTDLLVGLIVLTLAVNVILGVELYNALNRPVTLGQSVNTTLPITMSQGSNYNNVINTVATTTTANTLTITSSQHGSNESKVYNFTFVAGFDVNQGGAYEIIANVKYQDEVVVIHFPDGTTVTLTGQSPVALIHLDKGHYVVQVLVSFVSKEHVNPKDLGNLIKIVKVGNDGKD